MLLVWVELHGSRCLPWHTQRWEEPCYWYGSNCMGLDAFPDINNEGRSHANGMGRTVYLDALPGIHNNERSHATGIGRTALV